MKSPYNEWVKRKADPTITRQVLAELKPWLVGESTTTPARQQLADAVRGSLYTLAEVAPGATVEVRVPPFAAVQCLAGPTHTRGTPPNVVETDAKTWLQLAIGIVELADCQQVAASGTRALDIAHYLPLFVID